jgi:hypothetical protein
MRRIASALSIVGVVILLLGIAQLVLPGLAAQRIRDQLARSGRVLEVKVSAFPAIELLWHRADSVTVRMASYRSSAARLASLLAESGDAQTLRASAAVLRDGLLTVRDAVLVKRGERLTASALVREDDLRAAVPILQSVEPLASPAGQLVLRGTASAFGVVASIDAIVQAVSGRLEVTPEVPFGGLATLTLFDDPRVSVQAVSARPAPGGFALAARGVLR